MSELEWTVPLPKRHAEQLSTWKTAVQTIEVFAAYASTKIMSDIHPAEAGEAREALRSLLEGPAQ